MACAKLCNGAPPNVVCFFSYFSLYDNLVSHHLSVKRETEKKNRAYNVCAFSTGSYRFLYSPYMGMDLCAALDSLPIPFNDVLMDRSSD